MLFVQVRSKCPRKDLERGTIIHMEVGDRVLHPRYGVGIIDAIEKRVMDGESREYYVIPKPSISSTILVPVDEAEKLGLRPVSKVETLNEAIKILCGENDLSLEPCCSVRALCWDDPLALASAIRHKLTEPKARYPKVSEQQQLKRAKKLLVEEMTLVLGITEDRASAYVDGNAA